MRIAKKASCGTSTEPTAFMRFLPSKAWRIVNEAEDQLGCKLLDRNGALGSTLTEDGHRAVDGYRKLQAEVDALVARRLPELL